MAIIEKSGSKKDGEFSAAMRREMGGFEKCKAQGERWAAKFAFMDSTL
jgi:hypothetical protein